MNLLVHVALAPSTPKLYGRTVTTLFNAEWDGRLDLLFARNDHPAGNGTQARSVAPGETIRLDANGFGIQQLFRAEGECTPA